MKFVVLALGLVGPMAWSLDNVAPPITSRIGLDQKLGQSVSLDLPFIDEGGNPVSLSQLFEKGPVVLGLVYYKCPSLCSMVMNGAFRGLQGVKLKPGQEFSVVFVSIDPNEKPPLADAKKKKYLKTYLHSEHEKGMHFLTGSETTVKKLASQIGFRYEWDPVLQQFAHPGLLTILNPQGKISHYLFGVEFDARDLTLALVESSGGTIGSPVDHFLLYCFRYDPTVGKFGVAILQVLRLTGAMTVIGVFLLVWGLRRRERRRNQQDRVVF